MLFYLDLQMLSFAALYNQLLSYGKLDDPSALLHSYFTETQGDELKAAVRLLLGYRPRRLIHAEQLRKWCCESANIPFWLYDESLLTVKDHAETAALILQKNVPSESLSLSKTLSDIASHLEADTESISKFIEAGCDKYDGEELYLFIKLILGSFRSPVPEKVVIRSLSSALAKDERLLAKNLKSLLSGDWNLSEGGIDEMLIPYAFYEPQALDDIHQISDRISEYCYSWSYDGLPVQVLINPGSTEIWTADKRCLNDRLPELQDLHLELPIGTALQGYLMIMKNGVFYPHSKLSLRLDRIQISKDQLRELPVVFIADDVLAMDGKALIDVSFKSRRIYLEELAESCSSVSFTIAELLAVPDEEALDSHLKQSRAEGLDGVLIRHASNKNHIYVLKMPALEIMASLIYITQVRGKRGNLSYEFTFAVNDGDIVVPIAKMISTLSKEEMSQIEKYALTHTLERFGPVRSIEPGLIFRLRFEGVWESKRHKSGIVLRNLHEVKWLQNKDRKDIGSLQDLKKLLP